MSNRGSTWAMQQRAAFVWQRLAQTGELKRRHLADAFGVSLITAGHDIDRVRRRHAGAIDYDAATKRFVPGQFFHALMPADTPQQRAEREVGRLVYARIEELMNSRYSGQSEELGLLADIVAEAEQNVLDLPKELK